MNIKAEQVTFWKRALNAARWTVNMKELDKEPSEEFKTNILMAQHSPIRLVEYDIKIYGIPYRIATHIIRHHIGIEKFQCTLRDDRNNEITDSEELPQGQPVNLWIACNAEALINISKKRLCGMAHPKTRHIWEGIKKAVVQVDPIMERFMVKECIRDGFCPEDPAKSCMYVITKDYKEKRKEYCKGFLQPLQY